MKWMFVQSHVHRALGRPGVGSEDGRHTSASGVVDRLVERGLDPQDALDAWGEGAGRGELDAEAIEQVMAGALPMSWASAGA